MTPCVDSGTLPIASDIVADAMARVGGASRKLRDALAGIGAVVATGDNVTFLDSHLSGRTKAIDPDNSYASCLHGALTVSVLCAKISVHQNESTGYGSNPIQISEDTMQRLASVGTDAVPLAAILPTIITGCFEPSPDDASQVACPSRSSGRSRDIRAAALDKIYELDGAGKREETLDFIFDWFDDRLKDPHELPQCDLFLSEINVDRLTVRALIGVLSATLMFRDSLMGRSAFYERVKTKLQRERSADMQELLRGL